MNHRMDFQPRADLIHSVTNLHPSQLMILETVIGFPVALRPGAVAPSAERAAALVNWAESFGGPGLAAVARELARVLSEHMPPGAPSGAQNVAVNAPTGQVFNIQNLYGNVTAGGAETPPSAPPPVGKLINVPPRNDFFTGREEILSALHEALTQGGRAAIKQAISGLGGIGKTATATEYAHRYANDYARVLWTGAADATALNDGFAILARELGLTRHQKSEDTVAEVKRWLAENPGWLLILDNADTPEIVKAFLPNPLTGAALLTSRATNFATLTIAQAVELGVMPTDEAVDFLRRRTGRNLVDGEEAAARALAAELGHLPLALEQAAAYVAKTRVSFAKYLEIYRTRRLEILKKSRPETGDYRLTVETTWRLNFERVEAISPAAADVLRMSAYCAPEAIPFELIEKGAAEISETLADALAQAAVVNEVLSPLTEYSLIGLDGEREEYSVHRLVQAVVRDGMTESERREWIERGVKAVNAAFPDVTDFYQWGVCARLAPHGVALGEAAARAGAESAELALLLSRTGYFLKEQGRYAETAPLYERSLAIYEKALGAEHPHTATTVHGLARVHLERGEYGKAEALFERSLAIDEKALGAEHPDTGVSLSRLGRVCAERGEYEKSERLQVRARAILEKALGPEHPWTAESLDNLGNLYSAQGDATRAEELHARALAVRIKILGDKHPDTARSRWGLAATLWARGRTAEARELHEAALAGLRAALGEEHPDTKKCAAELAELPQE